jgi:hypothetical protein
MKLWYGLKWILFQRKSCKPAMFCQDQRWSPFLGLSRRTLSASAWNGRGNRPTKKIRETQQANSLEIPETWLVNPLQLMCSSWLGNSWPFIINALILGWILIIRTPVGYIESSTAEEIKHQPLGGGCCWGSSEKWWSEFVSWDDDIPFSIWWESHNPAMFQTTNQTRLFDTAQSIFGLLASVFSWWFPLF